MFEKLQVRWWLCWWQNHFGKKASRELEELLRETLRMIDCSTEKTFDWQKTTCASTCSNTRASTCITTGFYVDPPKGQHFIRCFCQMVQLLHNFRRGIETLLNQRTHVLMSECPFFTAFSAWCSDVAREKCITIPSSSLAKSIRCLLFSNKIFNFCLCQILMMKASKMRGITESLRLAETSIFGGVWGCSNL